MYFLFRSSGIRFRNHEYGEREKGERKHINPPKY